MITDDQYMRYLRYAKTLRSKKEQRDGLVGITRNNQGWRVKFPNYLDIPDKFTKTAVEAARAYNREVKGLLGSDAVLCDVQKATEIDRKEKK